MGDLPVPSDKKVIYVIDDDHTARFVIEHVLVYKGYTVITADEVNVIEHIRALRKLPDLILLDIIMPHISGLELGPALVQAFPSVRILYVSAYGDEMPPSWRSPNYLGLLRKPFTQKQLLEAVEKALA